MDDKESYCNVENTGLTIDEINRIRSLFSKYKQIDKVIIYGSRAMGNYRPASDIDLALAGNNVDSSLQQEIDFALDDLMLPYKFDLSIQDKIGNQDLIHQIEKTGKILYKRNPGFS